MAANNQLETKLDDVLGKKAPVQIPGNGKKAIVNFAPWASLVLGVLSLWSAYALWHWAHLANAYIDYANSLSRSLGGDAVATNRMSVGIWLAIAVVAVEGVLYLMAFGPLKARNKRGWDLLFYAMIVNAVYGLVVLFTDYGGVGNFIGYLIGTVIGLYVLFQIRSIYTGSTASAPVAPKV